MGHAFLQPQYLGPRNLQFRELKGQLEETLVLEEAADHKVRIEVREGIDEQDRHLSADEHTPAYAVPLVVCMSPAVCIFRVRGGT